MHLISAANSKIKQTVSFLDNLYIDAPTENTDRVLVLYSN